MSDAVAIYAPLDEGKARRMSRATKAIIDTVTPVYENDVGPADDGFSSYYLLRSSSTNRDEVRIETGDPERDRMLAEYIAGALNNHDDIMLAVLTEHLHTPDAAHQPGPESLDKLILHVATAPGPERRLDDRIHDTLHIGSTFARHYSGSFDAARALVTGALPGWGYKLSFGPSPNTTLVATLMRPAKNPDGSITDGESWSKHYSAAGANDALALVHAFLLAIRENPLETK